MTKEITYTAIAGVKDYRDPRIRPHLPALVACIRSAFDQPGFDQEDILNHLGGDLVILGLSQDKVASYASTNFNRSPRIIFGEGYPEADGSYFAAGAVARAFQHRGVYGQLNMLRVRQAVERGQRLIFTRTQNPFVEAGIQHALTSFGVTPQVERHYVAGCYGQMLTASRPVHRDPQLNQHYDRLDYDAGDAFVLMYHLRDRRKS